VKHQDLDLICSGMTDAQLADFIAGKVGKSAVRSERVREAAEIVIAYVRSQGAPSQRRAG